MVNENLAFSTLSERLKQRKSKRTFFRAHISSIAFMYLHKTCIVMHHKKAKFSFSLRSIHIVILFTWIQKLKFLYVFLDWQNQTNKAFFWYNRHGGSNWLRDGGCCSRCGWRNCDDKTFDWQQQSGNFKLREKKYWPFSRVQRTTVIRIFT